MRRFDRVWERLVGLSDADGTRAVYAQFGPVPCPCSGCRNIRAQPGLVPVAVRDLLLAMGIDPAKPHETIDYSGGRAARACELEWAFVGRAAPAEPDEIETEIDGCRVLAGRGVIGCPLFDESGRRRSISVLISGVAWVLPEPEPE